MADTLLEQTSDRALLRDELMSLLTAGRDTTASLLSNLFSMLARHPDTWRCQRQEMAFLAGRPPRHEQLKELQYLQCSLNESLRLHPPVPIGARARWSSTMSTPYIGAGGSIYGSDAAAFRPERWKDGLRPGEWAFLPFSGGPRGCLGQHYALAAVEYVTVRLGQRFTGLEERDGRPWREELGSTLSSRDGVWVGLRE
ncbi:cytochrome P450 [Aspergillus uvarum CBS 121591]|uniref:Cytochrome P450 n=1 Tax=Aspergillus uvarum CBS 121591 TaxID=1448315 RepID=A0A319CNU3_9EURO|nr:cytochrome P450 [Aspergillus uvarum CBS 121591]PYH86290.1 cytochrome P450 [Aspergillus uvarum CBS 121591]